MLRHAAALALLLAAAARAAVAPGDNFYRCVNGDWIAATPIPSGLAGWGTFDQIRKENLEKLHLLCERASAQGNDASPVEQKVGDFYASGMDEAQSNTVGAQPIGFEFDRIAALAGPADVLAEIGHLHALGVPVGFVFSSRVDPAGGGGVIAEIRQGGLGLPARDLYLGADEMSRKVRSQYALHIARMFALLGDMPGAAAGSALAVVRLETALAGASAGPAALRDPRAGIHAMTVADASRLGPGMDLASYVAKTGAPAFTGLNVAQPEFLAAFAAALAARPVADWQAYLRWHVIHEFAPYLSDAFAGENFAFFQTALNGVPRMQPRWKAVMATIDTRLGDAIGQLYAADYCPPESRARAQQLVADIRAALRARLLAAAWMDAPTRGRAVAKLDALTVKVGYPDTWTDYASLLIDRGPYVLDVLKSKAFAVRRDLRRIGRPADPAEWPVSVVGAAGDPGWNVGYEASRNEIVIPAGILQPPLFGPAGDDAVLYGSLGAIIGHELTHGFDDQGALYGEGGGVADWRSEASAARYRELEAAIIRQFNGCTALPGLRVNGELTARENIADLGGVQVAYAALEASLAGKPHASVGGLTPEQRFFIAYASMLRAKHRPEALRMALRHDVHAPEEFRCNGPLSNLDEFAAAFGIPAGAPMRRAPADRISIW